MGFCARCGDLIRGTSARCSKCGGRPLERTTASTTDTSPANDKWMSSYIQRHISKADADESFPLGNVAGSTLDPVSKLSKWSCSLCRQMFTPSATIYSDPQEHDSRYCQGCYRRRFQKGTCCKCYKGVFPDQRYIHMDRYYWHKTCFKCVGCLKDVSEDPLIDLDKRPCCESCFENEAGHVPSIAATPAEDPLSPENAEKLTMAELNAKLTGVSLDSLSARQSSEHSRPDSPSSASATDSSNSRPNTPATPMTGNLVDHDDKAKELPSVSTRTTLPPISRPYNPPPSNYPAERPAERPFERSLDHTFERPSDRPVRRTHKAYSASISIPQETMKESALYARRFNVATPAPKVESPSKDLTDEPCVKCNKVEGSKTFTPQGKIYHRECLTCAKCQRTFTNEHCFESGDQFYHKQCSPVQRRLSFATPVRKPGYNVASSIFASRAGGAPKFASNLATCPRCRQSVVFIEQTPGPMNSKWHKRCLNCYSCHKQLDSSAKVLVADQPPPSPTKRGSQTPQLGYAGTSPTLSRSASVSLAVKAMAPQKPVTDDEDALTRVFCRACYDAERIRLGYTTATTLSRSASAIIRR